jgi:hypothetical protein
MNKLEAMQNINPVLVSTDELVDINDVEVNKSLSKAERIADFVRQIKNPYCFKCGDFVVKARFSDNGLSMEDCLQSILI